MPKKPDIWYYTDNHGKLRWRAMVRGKVLAVSYKGYKDKEDAAADLRSLFGGGLK